MRRPLLLWGFMATGKTTVGRTIAELTGADFEDLDARIEQAAGSTIAEIFRARGEAAFRELERSALSELLADGRPRVVALGGGALLRREARLSALERAVVVTLRASPETLAARLSGDRTRPLLDVPDASARVEELLELRERAYSECHETIDTGVLDVDRAARAALDVWRRDPIAVAAGERSYAVDVGRDLAAERLSTLVHGATRVLLVSDENVARLHAAKFANPSFTRHDLVPGEAHKNAASLGALWSACQEAELDRKSRIVALGGGVVTDIAGLCAATWMRGIPWIALPTTLLAMVDASVGGKTGVDLDDAKNAIGAFWQPLGVACDVSLLDTEPQRGFVSALAEVVKSALIGDAVLFDRLERNVDRVLARDPELLVEIVRRSIAVKASVVSRDEREQGLRAVLNLGHTVGHALEARAGYSALSHGEAVSLGLVAALRLGVRLGQTPAPLAERSEALLARFGLPIDLSAQPLADAAARLGFDKKRAGSSLRFVVARDVGSVAYIDLPIAELRDLVSSLATLQ